MRGGLVFFRGAGAEARAYLESDHSHADDYYLEGGGAVAEWTAWDGAGGVIDSERLDGATYQAWVDWMDPRTGVERGVPREEVRVRENGEIRVSQASPRFVEMTVNCDKSLSVASALNPEVSVALDAAQAAAVDAMNTYMAGNSVTRVGARGAQRFVPAERLESVAVVHRTSRAGDPHRHVHVQWSTRVYAEGKWRSLHTAATLKQQGALRGVGEAAINSHAGLQRALADAGFELDPASGRVVNLAEQSKVMSKRSSQVQRNVARLEAEWRQQHPGREPDKTLRRSWDQEAWALDRPRKANANLRGEAAWTDELRAAGLQVSGFGQATPVAALTLAQVDTERLFEQVTTVAAARGSAWSVADLAGHVGVAIAGAGVAATSEQITAYVDERAREFAARLPQLPIDVPGELPSWVRYLTSERVIQVERELRTGFAARGLQSGLTVDDTPIGELNRDQSAAARALASTAPLVVIEGAAGSGKTTMLAAGRELALQEGRDFVVVAPTRRAAREAADALGANASSAHRLVFEHGYRWDDSGRWWRLHPGEIDDNGRVYDGPADGYALTSAVRVVVDEAGMVDQDLAHALLTIADETGAPLAFIGDRAQLPAVGRGGVLDMVVGASARPLDLTELHRFREPGYAELTIQMRDRTDPGVLFDQLQQRGNIVLHTSDVDVNARITADVVAKATAGATVAVAVTSNDAAAELNALVQDARSRAGHTRLPATTVAGSDGLTLRVGDRVMTRWNDTDLQVNNRDTWTVDRVHRDGSVTVAERGQKRRLPREYVEEHTHLAYASTTYGVQGATVDYAHGILTESTTAQSLYVAATRGREHNAVHIVADDVEQARTLFVDAMNRESGDRGVEAARAAVARDLDGMVLPGSATDSTAPQHAMVPQAEHEVPAYDVQLRAQRLAAQLRVHDAQLREYETSSRRWRERHEGVRVEDYPTRRDEAVRAARAAAEHARTVEHMHVTSVVDERRSQWRRDYDVVADARAAAETASPLRRRAAQQTAVDATGRFESVHRMRPTRVIPPTFEAQWRREAAAVGSSRTVDDARAAAATAQQVADRLQSDPPPTRPMPPKAGTPEQEAARDSRFAGRQQRRSAAAARETRAPSPHLDLHREGPRGFDR